VDSAQGCTALSITDNREPQHTRPHFSVKKRIATQTRFSADLQKYKRHFCEGIIGLLPVLTIK